MCCHLWGSLLGCVTSVLYSFHHCEAHVCDHRVTGWPDPCPVPRMMSSPGCCPNCGFVFCVYFLCFSLCGGLGLFFSCGCFLSCSPHGCPSVTGIGSVFPLLSHQTLPGLCSRDTMSYTDELNSPELLPPSRASVQVLPIFPIFPQLTLDCRIHTEEGSTGSHLRSGPVGSVLCPCPCPSLPRGSQGTSREASGLMG